jgi:hypothetical protein
MQIPVEVQGEIVHKAGRGKNTVKLLLLLVVCGPLLAAPTQRTHRALPPNNLGRARLPPLRPSGLRTKFRFESSRSISQRPAT